MRKVVTILFISLAFVCTFAIIACSKRNINEETFRTPLSLHIPAGWPQPKYNFANNPLTAQGFELGKKLFYDSRLSKDGTISCGSCHQQVAAFGTFDHDFSHGINNSHTLRNAPALQNLAWQKEFGWDGAAKSLDDKIIDHITAADEMGETVDNVLKKLKPDADYNSMFAAAFTEGGISAQNLTKSLSQFILMMVTSNSKYDKVFRNEAIFTMSESNGYAIFKQKCATCHMEPLFTDFSYRSIGIPVNTFLNDYGLMRVTGKSTDSLKFKVPAIRNADRTFPYGHDGRFTGFDQVFEHYRSGIINSATTDPLVRNKIALSNFEFGLLKSFISTLTDTSFIHNPKFHPL